MTSNQKAGIPAPLSMQSRRYIHI